MASVKSLEQNVGTSSSELSSRYNAVKEYARQYAHHTHDVLGVASTGQTQDLLGWMVDQMKADDEESIKNREVFIDKFLKDQWKSADHLYEQEFLETLNKANGSISKTSYEEWIKRFKDRSVYYKVKEHFIRNKLPGYVKNWNEVAGARKKLLTDKSFSLLSPKDVQNLSAFKSEESFLKLSYKKRVALVSEVQGALFAKEKQMPQLHAKAKGMLEAAARAKSMSWNKIGTWLERIFKSGAKPQQIEDFLNNEGPMPLQKLISNWQEASAHFKGIETKREKLGTPRSFHFVKMEVFLNWGYEQRQSYLQEAEHRFVDIMKEPEVFLKIRHELDMKDWEGADELIAQAEKEEWGTENTRKLKALSTFLKRHRVAEPPKAEGKEEEPTGADLLREMKALLDVVPPSARLMYEDALADGYQPFWSFTVLMYNRIWCHQHGFYDEKKEKLMEEEAKDPTRQRMEEGHGSTHEVNVIKGDTADDDAIRDQGNLNRAQIDFVDPNDANSRGALTRKNKLQCGNRCWWYWTSIIPQGLTYGEHLYIVQNIHPRMKKIARQLEAKGLRYNRSLLALGGAAKAKPSLN